MVILANKNLPRQALQYLTTFGDLIMFQTEDITYSAISGHPDIFFCPNGNGLIIAPNVPEAFKQQFSKKNLSWTVGYEPVGSKYPETARYNCVLTDQFVIGHIDFIDKKILEETSEKEIIHVNQGYTRCNLIPLSSNKFITSDKGIEGVLLQKGLEVLYVNPGGIRLPDFDHGFIGGSCGVTGNKVFYIGNLMYYSESEKIRSFLSEYEIIELYDGPLFDGGSLIILS
jgi:hypothetical protein